MQVLMLTVANQMSMLMLGRKSVCLLHAVAPNGSSAAALAVI